MANIKSQIKRNRQNERRRVRNKAVRTALKTSAKKVRTSADQGDGVGAQAELLKTVRQLDQAASRGAVHKRTAARRKSRLARAVNAASSSS